ncbi:MAG: c-type cytochrome [Anaerolineales bacterium]
MKISLLFLLILSFTTTSSAEDVAIYFRQNCASCHTIGGGRLTGPDLKNVTQRLDRGWLERFILNPKALIDSGDPYAVKIKQESRDVIMPTIPTLTPDLVKELINLIEAESKLETSQFVGLTVGDEPFTSTQIDQGLRIFQGKVKLSNGGAACISCHTVNGLGGLSGGRLGPDLTLVYERLQGRRALASWLNAPATITMQPLFAAKPFTQDEILALTAFFEEIARKGGQDTSPAALNFFLIGLIGTIVALTLFETIWKGRFRAVRRPQVEASALKLDGQYPKVAKPAKRIATSSTSIWKRDETD